MDDLISRQAVLKLLSTIPPEEAITKAMLIQSVKQMDAAQPSGPDNLVKDSQCLVNDLANDCISRQAAIDALEQAKEQYFDRRVIIGKMQDVVSNLPSAQPERPKGKWIFTKTVFDRHGWTVECPSCHKKWKTYDEIRWKKENKFCPNCGADMRGEEECC